IDRFLEMELHVKPIPAYSVNEHENGNGSLMRMLPLIFFLASKPPKDHFKIISEVSALTHAHDRSVIGCFIYVEYAIELLKGTEKHTAYHIIKSQISGMLDHLVNPAELNYYCRLLEGNINEYPEESIKSSTYVLHTLEAVIWTLLRSQDFSETLLNAVNLGGDTDTIGALAGGLAGLIYPLDQISGEWITKLARKDDILDLSMRFSLSL
ncbi:MAG: ADP-ribosylglycohydrolase family protein, partial [Bacteroidota bacterium]